MWNAAVVALLDSNQSPQLIGLTSSAYALFLLDLLAENTAY